MAKTAVVALGGNAFTREGQAGTYDEIESNAELTFNRESRNTVRFPSTVIFDSAAQFRAGASFGPTPIFTTPATFPNTINLNGGGDVATPAGGTTTTGGAIVIIQPNDPETIGTEAMRIDENEIDTTTGLSINRESKTATTIHGDLSVVGTITGPLPSRSVDISELDLEHVTVHIDIDDIHAKRGTGNNLGKLTVTNALFCNHVYQNNDNSCHAVYGSAGWQLGTSTSTGGQCSWECVGDGMTIKFGNGDTHTPSARRDHDK